MVGLKGLKQFRTLAGNFSRVFLYGASVHLTIDARLCIYLIACIPSTNKNAQNVLGKFCTL